MTHPGGTSGRPRGPVRFVFGVHLHQPVGNFDHVFRQHAQEVYRPLIEQLTRRHEGTLLLHISGPLLEWLESHDVLLLDRIGRLAADGRIEFLLGGMYEPILAAIPRADRAEQIGWHRDSLRVRFGVDASGLWLTERVWEPELAYDLAMAGVRYALVDDRHFLVTGLERDALHAPYRTESDGRALTLLAIDERLRYMIPFRPPEELAAYFRELHTAGQRLAVFADDGEKFGGWPGTREWVYERGWFERFYDALDGLVSDGIVRLSGGIESIEAVPSAGLAYLPTASYREMEAWSLPARPAVRLAALESDLGAERMSGPDGALVRGSHWRNFLTKYTEANRLQKKTSALSALCRSRGDPPAARRAIARAQCNDALWHGVFGGLYLPHLRGALWHQLAIAERELRVGEQSLAETLDLDADGADEVWIHSGRFSAVVAPARGGSLVDFTHFADGVNFADTLTRRLEAYHVPHAPHAGPVEPGTGTPSIHDIEAALMIESPPPVDLDDRAIGVARLISAEVSAEDFAAAKYAPLQSWARARCKASYESRDDGMHVWCVNGGFGVEWVFDESGSIGAHYWWDSARVPGGARFAVDLSLAVPRRVNAHNALAVWRHDIETVGKSERGFERTRQGEAVTPIFDAASGDARFELLP
ncbi:MAG: alpha-amylase/4-alpha-glucanotransferase domain-containing protein [Gemmatimonadales bacterium]